MVKKAKVDYDFENDVLYVYTSEKVQDSLDIDNFVLISLLTTKLWV